MKYSENITKQKIFENSVILFSEKGFDSVSMREIADSVGIRASSIYNHFKSKENILDEIFNYFVSELYDNKFPDGKKDAYNFIAMKIPLSDYLKSGMAVFADNHNSSLQNRIWKIITKNTDIKSKGFFIREMLKAPKNYWKDFFSVLSEKKIIKNINAEILAEEFFSYQVSILFEYVIIKDTDSVFSEEIKNKLFTHIDFFCSAI